jgi:hypothetical protein
MRALLNRKANVNLNHVLMGIGIALAGIPLWFLNKNLAIVAVFVGLIGWSLPEVLLGEEK